MAAPITPARTIDARGLRCPLPLIKARNQIDDIKTGEVMEILATDPGAEHDFRAWCARKHHQLVSVEELPGPEFRFLIRRA
jgi:tRNA 2-thiouridine synthesizing protein A